MNGVLRVLAVLGVLGILAVLGVLEEPGVPVQAQQATPLQRL
jgi:hypothetical protein